MSRRTVWANGVPAGTVVKYVGATARTMGSDPAYAAHPADSTKQAAVFTTWTDARDWLIRFAS